MLNGSNRLWPTLIELPRPRWLFGRTAEGRWLCSERPATAGVAGGNVIAMPRSGCLESQALT